MTPTPIEALRELVEAALWCAYCPAQGGYRHDGVRDGRSVEDCWEQLQAAAEKFTGVQADDHPAAWASEEDAEAIFGPALAALAHPVSQEAQAQAVPASPPVSSIDAAQRRGYLGEPEDWREACRLFRARCTPDDASKMAKLRTYIEDGLLVVVRPDRLAAQSVPVAHPAAGWIPVSGRLPERHQDFIALNRDGRVFRSRMCYGMHEPWFTYPHGDKDASDTMPAWIDVIGWMPLPAPPAETAEKTQSE